MALVAAPTCAAALDCADDHFAAASTMASLPGEVRGLLLKEGRVADQGQRYLDGDVVDRDNMNLPTRRLAIAAIGDRHVAAAIEINDAPTEIRMFERTGDQWADAARRTSVEAPVSLAELLYPFCDGYPKPEPRPESQASGVTTSDGSVILTLIDSQSSITYKLNRRPALRGTARYEQISYLQTKKPLSPRERAALRTRLAQLQSVLPGNAAGSQFVSEYLKVLDNDPGKQPNSRPVGASQ